MPVTLLLALAALLLPPQDVPPLVPDTPDGWRPERLAFPLTFAPEIELSGHEELRFAPGMFEPDAETYWTYLFALQLDGEVEVDGEFLASFLTRYYRGLARATRGERDFDPQAVNAEVSSVDGRLLARVDTFDSFVTGEPLALRIEFDVHQRPGATEVLALASPRPLDGPAWSLLHELGRAWREARPPAVVLNHLYLIPDAETYAAVAGSELLRTAFGVFEERTTVRADVSYTGVYLYGERTYFEFLEPDAAAGFAAGGTGLAFGVETPGGTAIHATRLRQQGVGAFAGPRTRELDDEQVPWFLIMGIERPTTTSTLNLFTLEYDPAFLQRWHADEPPAVGGITRAAVLARYAAQLGQHTARDELPMQDVTEVRLALDPAGRERLLLVCRSFGHTITEDAESATITGPGLRLVVTPSDSPGGITGFDVALRHAVEPASVRLGQLVVELADRKASFELPRGK